ncbi:hypothetical protein L1887_53388 [Cichorium endivia]|nr:hypothetical protein L1887_53388 [Cichorium endivia]
MEWNLPLKKDICLTQAFRSHFLLKEDRKKLKVEKEGSDVYEQNEPQIEKADQGEIPLSIGVLRWERKIGRCVSPPPHLSYTFDQGCHCEAIVKVHGVLPSSRWYFPHLHGEFNFSPGPCRRQRGSRYTIRAGRYLCDKEFRYLRTVRVTAAVYRGFHSKLITLLLPTFQHRAAISDLGWPFTPSHKSSPYFATYVGSVLQGLLELSSTCSWLDRSVSGQIGRTRRFHLWKAPTPNGLSRCSHFLADPSCKRYAVRVSALD